MMSARSSAARHEPIASASEVRALAVEITKLAKTTGFERRLRIGELTLRRLFADRIEESELNTKPPQLTIRRLCRALNGTVSKSDLHRCINTVLVSHFAFVPTSGQLTGGRVDAVARLPHGAQSELLKTAELNGWSCRQWRQARQNRYQESLVSTARSKRSPASLLPHVSRMTNQLDRFSISLKEGQDARVDGKDLRQLAQCLTAIREACDALRQRKAGYRAPSGTSVASPE